MIIVVAIVVSVGLFVFAHWPKPLTYRRRKGERRE
jgi:hypothetical protein